MEDLNINKVKEELKKTITDIDRYRFKYELDDGIITISYYTGTRSYEACVDAGHKSLKQIIEELTPRVVILIENCNRNSP